MNAPNTIRRPIPRAARIRVFHAYALMAALERLSPATRRQARRRIAGAAVTAMMVLKRGLDITSHPFEAAGYALVLSARWSEPRAILTIEVDLRQKGVPAVTLVGPPVPRWRRRE
jgi:hypothetical protein